MSLRSRQIAVAVAVALSLVAVGGQHDAAAAGFERPILVGELRPVSGEREVGVAHVKPRPDGPDRLVAVFAKLDPGARYALALSRSSCSEQPEPAIVLRRGVGGGESGSVLVKGRTATELRDRPLRKIRSVVLFDADRKPSACGRLSVGRPTNDPTKPGLVVGELNPAPAQSGVGIGHLRYRPGGPDSAFGLFINLDPKARHSLGLSRTTCSATTQTSPIDTSRASADGTLLLTGPTDLNLKPNHFRGTRSMVPTGPTGTPMACGQAGLMSQGELDTW